MWGVLFWGLVVYFRGLSRLVVTRVIYAFLVFYNIFLTSCFGTVKGFLFQLGTQLTSYGGAQRPTRLIVDRLFQGTRWVIIMSIFGVLGGRVRGLLVVTL